jgi:hypothetical protein
MGFLDNTIVNEDQVSSPYFMVLYGKGGCGKSELASRAEKPFFFAIENGIEELNLPVGSFKENCIRTGEQKVKLPESRQDIYDGIKFLITTEHNYKTVVIDSGKFIDLLFTKSIIKEKPTETVSKKEIQVQGLGDYNYPYGYDHLLRSWNRLIHGIDALKNNGINVILIAHSCTFNEENPISGEKFKKAGVDLVRYGQYNVGDLLFAKCDAMYYMRSEIQTTAKKGGRGGETIKHGTEPEYIVYTRSKAGFDAKVRARASKNIHNYYIIDRNDEETSKKVFQDLI